MASASRQYIVLALLALTAACRAGSDTARGVAERFIDEHYVRIDLRAAKAYCVGVARQKLEQEERLVEGYRIDEATRQPRVTYSLEEERREGTDRASYLFEGDIYAEGADVFKRHWLVMTRREGDGTWKVSNFEEFE